MNKAIESMDPGNPLRSAALCVPSPSLYRWSRSVLIAVIISVTAWVSDSSGLCLLSRRSRTCFKGSTADAVGYLSVDIPSVATLKGFKKKLEPVNKYAFI